MIEGITMFVCKFCGKILEDGSRFCNSCGAMVTDPAKASDMYSAVQSTELDENITLDSLIGSIDTFSVSEQDDLTTVAFSEGNGEMPTVPFNDEPDNNEDTDISDIFSKNTIKGIWETKKGVIVAIISILLIFILTSIALGESGSILSTNQQGYFGFTSTEIASTEIQSALNDKSMNRVRAVYSKYVPEYYDDSETVSEEAQAVVDELIVFYDNVYLELERYDESLYDTPYAFLREEYGDIVINNFTDTIDTIWIHGDAYAPDELLERVEKIRVLSWQKALE